MGVPAILAESPITRGTGLGVGWLSCDTGAVASEKPRILQNNRDLALSLIPLVIICLIVAGVAGQCSFSPGGPTQGEVPQYDAEGVLAKDARTYSMPLRLPQSPDGWTTNSGGHDQIDGNSGGLAIRVGYITDTGTYLKFVQSNAQAGALADFEAGESRPTTGHEQVAGVDWSVYTRDDAEPVWVAAESDVRWALTGSAEPGQFRQLAEVIAQTEPLPQD